MLRRRNIPGTKPNYFYSVLGVALVLVMLGLFGLISFYANRFVEMMRESVNILIEIKTDAEPALVQDFVSDLEDKNFVKAGSVEFISKEKGAKMMQEEFGEEFLKLDMPNPLYDIVSFNVPARFMTTDSLQNLRSNLKENLIVSDVFYQQNIADLIAGNIKKIGLLALGLGIFLLAVSVLLIHNTIRLALYSNRFLIKNMELVGASWEFISKPYIFRSALHGFLSGLIAMLVLAGVWWLIQTELKMENSMSNPVGFLIIAVSLVCLGVFISTLSTFYVVKKYLKMRVDEMY
ncbi:MAG TPA: permease-like cell division protein FtsX [Saprospiraceae bacterium]|nr:permease-like cell division protein FtsX [Saprospiraceae bacterium]